MGRGAWSWVCHASHLRQPFMVMQHFSEQKNECQIHVTGRKHSWLSWGGGSGCHGVVVVVWLPWSGGGGGGVVAMKWWWWCGCHGVVVVVWLLGSGAGVVVREWWSCGCQGVVLLWLS